MENNRNLFADFLKGILIFLVVFGHSIQYIKSYNDAFWYDAIFKYIYSFHMPLFIAISGYFTYKSLSKKSAIVFLKERIPSLLIPLILWGAVMAISDIMSATHEIQDKGLYIFRIIINSYWFIWAILIYSVILGFLKLIKLNNNYIILIIGILSMTAPAFWSNITLIFVKDMFCFFVIGYLLASFDISKIYSICKKYFIVLIILSVLCYINWQRETLIYFTPADIFHFKLSFQRFYTGIIMSISFIIIMEYLFKAIRKIEIKRIVSLIGKETLGIYLIQAVFFNALRSIYPNTMTIDIPSVVLILPTILAIIIIHYLIKLLDKYKITAFLLLGKRHVNKIK